MANRVSHYKGIERSPYWYIIELAACVKIQALARGVSVRNGLLLDEISFKASTFNRQRGRVENAEEDEGLAGRSCGEKLACAADENVVYKWADRPRYGIKKGFREGWTGKGREREQVWEEDTVIIEGIEVMKER